MVAGTVDIDDVSDVTRSGGADDGGGTEQYARQGRGSLSGLKK